jgi:hypothetical protein
MSARGSYYWDASGVSPASSAERREKAIGYDFKVEGQVLQRACTLGGETLDAVPVRGLRVDFKVEGHSQF